MYVKWIDALHLYICHSRERVQIAIPYNPAVRKQPNSGNDRNESNTLHDFVRYLHCILPSAEHVLLPKGVTAVLVYVADAPAPPPTPNVIPAPCTKPFGASPAPSK